MEFVLFENIVPKTVKNFIELTKGTNLIKNNNENN